MTFQEWRALSPGAAARELHARVGRLSSAQQRAALADLCDKNQLATRFAATPRDRPLGGVPFLAKDLFDVAGLATRAGSTFLPEVRPVPTQDSALIRAFAEIGGICAGKTQMHEFAYGITGENPHFGDCEHPRFPGRTTGGSSSGSAAAVAAGIVPLALGTDTGGSVRVPAAFCGLFGFRLTPGDAWIADAFPLARSFDTAGWFTANAADLRTVLAALVGLPPAGHPPRGCYLEPSGLDPEVAQACRRAAERFAPMADAAARDHLLTGFSRAIETYTTIVAAEAWTVHQPWADRYRARYDPAVWQRLLRARALSRAEIDVARRDLEAVRQLWTTFFQTYDFLVLPASPTPALTKAECTLENRLRILALTAPASLGGLPVLTIPVPLAAGLTTGLQIVVQHPKSPVIDWALRRLT